MANSSTGMTGTARFLDCGCGNCQAGRTHDDALSTAAPEIGLDPASAARRNHPSLNKESPWEAHMNLPATHTYRVEEVDNKPVLMRRPIIMSKANDGGGDAAYQAETNRLREINRANAAHYAKLALDPSRAMMGH